MRGWDRLAASLPEAAQHGVLLMNTKSGGGKAEKYDLPGHCARRGIEPVELTSEDDLRALAEDAVARGADVIGMAGGDGSLAIVAAVAAAHNVPFVCVPAGTRNHFALDLGVDRDDIVGSLDAFGEAHQARIDLAEVNGRVFVNNVSLGIYAQIVASNEYRSDKLRTATRMLPTLLAPDAPPSGLHVRMPSGALVENPQVVIVSNNPYRLKSLAGFGTRIRLNRGVLGAAVLLLASPNDVTRFVAAETAGQLDQFPGWQIAQLPEFDVTADHTVAAGIDGEAVELHAAAALHVTPTRPDRAHLHRSPRPLTRIAAPGLGPVHVPRAGPNRQRTAERARRRRRRFMTLPHRRRLLARSVRC
jgi:diacylglycerol kinase family enzyme